jgi:hypothetical protein
MGRPRMRWLKDFEKEIGKTKVKIWRQKAVNGEEWAVVTNVAKGLRGQYCHGVRKKKCKFFFPKGQRPLVG